MAEWVTLSRADSHFEDYLRGTFSSLHRAIPEISQRNGEEFKITFRIDSVDSSDRPHWLQVCWKAIRAPYLTFTISPIIASVSMLLWKGWAIEPILALCAFLGVIFLQIAGHLFNDYNDHMSGVDLEYAGGLQRGSRVIQNGWVPACRVQQAAWVCLALGAVIGASSLWAQPRLIFLIGLGAVLGLIGFSAQKSGLKNRGMGEVALFTLMGPMLTAGFSMAASGKWDYDVAFLGAAFGVVTAHVYFLKNLHEIFLNAQNRVASLAGWLGFDRSIKLAKYGIWVLPLGLFLRSTFDWNQGIWFFMGVFLIWPVWHLSRSISQIRSCLSSGVDRVRLEGLGLHLLFGLVVSFVFTGHILFR